MRIDTKIYINDNSNNALLGRGPVELLESIDKMGSVRKAAISMNMSYSKAHKMIKNIEMKFGKEVFRKSIGGSCGGGTVLTDYGKKLVSDYKKLEKNIKKYAVFQFDKIMK
jgi:molybdate transport repressor ModE-like protein